MVQSPSKPITLEEFEAAARNQACQRVYRWANYPEASAAGKTQHHSN